LPFLATCYETIRLNFVLQKLGMERGHQVGTPAHWFARGNELAGRHRYDEAVYCYDRAFELMPGNANLLRVRPNT
jgi:hypothetical protein